MTGASTEGGAAWEELLSIDGVGETMATSLVTTFHQEAERASIDRLVAELDIEPVEAPQTEGSPVAGKTVVFTGTLEKMTRAEAKARAEALGPRCRARSRPRPICSSPVPVPGRKPKGRRAWDRNH